jgi:hypothetical protein
MATFHRLALQIRVTARNFNLETVLLPLKSRSKTITIPNESTQLKIQITAPKKS